MLELLGAPGPAIVALGGGAVETGEVRDALADHVVIHVDVDLETAWDARRRARPGRWPATARGFDALYARRRPLYEALARAVVVGGQGGRRRPAGGPRAGAARRAAQRADAVVACGRRPPGLRRHRRAGCRRCAVARPRAAVSWSRTSARSRCTARRCSARCPRRSRSRTRSPCRPASATRALPRPSACCARWRGRACSAATRCSRSAAASSGTSPASARRPISAAWRSCTCRPRVVAQVDSAYGGKTGVDIPEAKNYVGAFHQPAAVITDPRRAGDAAGRGAELRVRRGREDRADRRRGAVGARARAAAARARPSRTTCERSRR